MILITGATGPFGRTTIEHLIQKGVTPAEIAVLVRDETKAEDFKAKGIQVIKGDYHDFDSLLKAFQGVDKVLFVSSSEIQDRSKQHENVVKAAGKAGVKHVYYTSFERKNESDNSPIAMIAESHIHTENLLKESGIQYTILKNGTYLDMLPMFIGDKVLETGVIYIPSGKGKTAAALRSELAEATASVITSTGHENKSYNFSNSEAFTYSEVAEIISQTTGKKVNHISPTVEDFITTLSKEGVPEMYIHMTAGFARAQEQGEFDKTDTVLEKLLGRKPTTVREFIHQLYSSN